jgi:hypothetical protein
VDTDAMQLSLLYRAMLRAHGRIDEFESVRFAVDGLEVAA